jgi:hypothetical protein
MDEGQPVSYMAITVGTPVLSSSGAEFGQVHHVLQIPELDLFDGISVKTKDGLRFVDRDQITDITTTLVKCSITDEQAAALPPPHGAADFEFDNDYDTGPSLTARLGRLFDRPGWKRVD